MKAFVISYLLLHLYSIAIKREFRSLSIRKAEDNFVYFETENHQVFEAAGASKPSKIILFPSKSRNSSTGPVEFNNKVEALEALVLTNNCEVPDPDGGRPFMIKLRFD